jgi:hypothetical protein
MTMKFSHCFSALHLGFFRFSSRPRPQQTGGAWRTALIVVLALLVLNMGHASLAQNLPGPYGANWGYGGPIYYNPTYAQYGLPGVGVSPWDPIVQAQLNLGMRTARYQMYDAWANQSNAAANLFYQQAIAQSIQNAQQQQAVPPRYDVRQRVPRPAPATDPTNTATTNTTTKLLPRNQVMKDNGEVIWPASAPSDGAFGRSRAAAEAAIRVAVKEFQANGQASIQSVAEAKSLLFAYGKPALEELVQTNRAQAKRLWTFFTSLEHVLNGLAGE